MSLTKKQKGVAVGMAVGMVISLSIVIIGAWLNPFSYNATLTRAEILSITLQWLLLPSVFLVVSIGRLAKHRFFTPEDIDGGGGLSQDTGRAQYLQTLLQNTLEQLVIAIVVYPGWAITMPVHWLSVVPLAAISFAIGRILFFSGYKGGAPSRALGFALTFYPSVLMLLCMIAVILWRLLD